MSAISEVITQLMARIKSSDIATRMASGAFWSLTGTAIARALVMVAGIVCAHILSKEIYGQFGMVKTTIATFMAIGGSGISLAATKYVSEYRKSHPELISSIYFVTNGFALLMSLVVTALLYFLSDLIAARLDTPELSPTLKLASFILIFVVVNIAQEGVIAGFEDFKSKSIATFIGGVLQAMALLVGAYFWGLNGAIVGYGLGFAIISVLYRYFISKNMRAHSIKLDWRKVKRSDFSLLYRFVIPAALSSIVVVPTFFVIRVLLKDFMSFGTMADYDVGEQWRVMILFVPSSVSHIVLPILASINKEQNKFWKVTHASLAINGAVTLLIAAVVIALSGWIITFYGKAYNNPWPLVFLSASCVFAAMAEVVGKSIASLARIWAIMLMNLLWSSIAIGLTYVFLRMGMGTTAPALAILISYIVHLVVQYLYLRVAFSQTTQETNQ